MFLLDSDPDVHRYLGGDSVTDIREIDEVIRFIRRQCIDNGIGRWAVIDKRAGTFISWAGLKWVTEPMNGYDFYKVLLKSGFRLAGQFELDGAAHNWYEIRNVASL